MHPVRFTIDATADSGVGTARAGTGTTARGSYTTPLFMPVGTRGAIKYLSAADYDRLGAQIVLDCPSVGATETILMAAVLADGVSTIENAAQEPEVQDLANLLNSMGAQVSGAGGPVITVQGVERLRGCTNYPVIPDRIEAGTFLMAAAITRSPLVVEPVIPEHLSAVIQKLRDCGCSIEIKGRAVTITPGEITAVDITTQPFPGFPTDLQAPFMALMCTAKGTSVISEEIYENRLQHVAELQRMGASIRLKGSTAIVEGVAQLSARPSPAPTSVQPLPWCWLASPPKESPKWLV